MKKYFYCQSYQAFNMALKMNMDEEVIVITAAGNIIKACDYLGIKYITHKLFSQRDLILKRNLCKSELKRLLCFIDTHEIHFSHTQFAVFCFLLISQSVKCSKKVVFHDFEFLYKRINIIPLNNFNNLILLIRYHLIRILYDAPLQLGMSSPGAYMMCLRMKYVESSCISIIHDKETYFEDTLKGFKNIKLPELSIDILFIAQTFTDNKFFDLNKIKEVLRLIDNPGVHIKMHPKIKNVDELKRCQYLPDFLPVELFFGAVKRIVISFHSASLITASKFDNLFIISLLDIVGANSDFLDTVREELRDKSNNRIHFPSDIEEFKKMLNVSMF